MELVLAFLANVAAAAAASGPDDPRTHGPWKVFPRQEFAFQWADAQQGTQQGKQQLRYFSFEEPRSGTRRFLVSTYEVRLRLALRVMISLHPIPATASRREREEIARERESERERVHL